MKSYCSLPLWAVPVASALSTTQTHLHSAPSQASLLFSFCEDASYAATCGLQLPSPGVPVFSKQGRHSKLPPPPVPVSQTRSNDSSFSLHLAPSPPAPVFLTHKLLIQARLRYYHDLSLHSCFRNRLTNLHWLYLHSVIIAAERIQKSTETLCLPLHRERNPI